MNGLDRDILKAIEGYSKKRPQDLPGILAVVDARQRLVLTHEELTSGLARLIAAGKVAEAGKFRFFAPNRPPKCGAFPGCRMTNTCVPTTPTTRSSLRQLRN